MKTIYAVFDTNVLVSAMNASRPFLKWYGQDFVLDEPQAMKYSLTQTMLFFTK